MWFNVKDDLLLTLSIFISQMEIHSRILTFRKLALPGGNGILRQSSFILFFCQEVPTQYTTTYWSLVIIWQQLVEYNFKPLI